MCPLLDRINYEILHQTLDLNQICDDVGDRVARVSPDLWEAIDRANHRARGIHIYRYNCLILPDVDLPANTVRVARNAILRNVAIKRGVYMAQQLMRVHTPKMIPVKPFIHLHEGNGFGLS